jgi:hypothetical protein
MRYFFLLGTLLLGCSDRVDVKEKSRASSSRSFKFPAVYDVLLQSDKVSEQLKETEGAEIPSYLNLGIGQNLMHEFITKLTAASGGSIHVEELRLGDDVRIVQVNFLKKILEKEVRLDSATLVLSSKSMKFSPPKVSFSLPPFFPREGTISAFSPAGANLENIGEAILALIDRKEILVGLRTYVMHGTAEYAGSDPSFVQNVLPSVWSNPISRDSSLRIAKKLHDSV